MFFVGVVNHWVTVVAHKTKAGALADIYLLDSTNGKHLNQPSYGDVQSFIMRKVVWEKIKLGISPSIKFMATMYIQSLYS